MLANYNFFKKNHEPAGGSRGLKNLLRVFKICFPRREAFFPYVQKLIILLY